MKRLIFILLLTSGLSLMGSTPSEMLQEANDAYQRSEYIYAAELYENILQQGFVSPDLYYNLGNAYYKSNEIGHAILNYERALRLEPMNEDIKYNLKIAQGKTVDRIEEHPLLFYERWFLAAWSSQSLDGWAVTILILVVLLLSVVSLYLFSRQVSVKKASFYSTLFLFVLLLMSGLFAYKQYSKLNSEKEAIVMHPRTTAKSSPTANSPDLFLLHEGTKVNIRNSLGLWIEVSLPNGNVGWIKTEAVEVI